ncbi:MAG: macro domain-containing protein [Abitibacteriaceae bacterium]|nr:macro domain-containing protein [Abditibacteriaceae bacterium]
MTNIEFQYGDLLKAQVEALVNTVNCVGVMGKGIAHQFENRFLENSRIYKEACKAKQLRPGQILIVPLQRELENQLPHYIINFATKDHWRGRSHIEWIEEGLCLLIEEVRSRHIKSIAIPPLGCGNGGLDWEQVYPLIERAFTTLPEVQVLLFPPQSVPNAATMAAPPKVPNMREKSALYVKLLAQYSMVDLEFSQLELQKLAYLLQATGEPLKLHFQQMRYGPAASEIAPMLSRWEHHWTLGFGDGTGGIREPILLKPEVIEKANIFLREHPVPESEARVQKVLQLIEGMDTALGLELLATVHWVARHTPAAARNPEDAVKLVHNWNDRKQKEFSQDYIHKAWNRLNEQGWLQNLRPEWMEPFETDEVVRVTEFVNSHHDLSRVLEEAASHLRTQFSGATLWLHLWPNPEAGRDELTLLIISDLSQPQRLARLEEFDRRWWMEQAGHWQGIFGITLT